MPAPRRSNGFLPPVCKKPTMVFENFVGLHHQTKQQQLQQQVKAKSIEVDPRFIPWRQRLLQEIANIVDEHSKDADLAIKAIEKVYLKSWMSFQSLIDKFTTASSRNTALKVALAKSEALTHEILLLRSLTAFESFWLKLHSEDNSSSLSSSPGDPNSARNVLKEWYAAHSSKPYPDGDEKERLCRETGLSMKQLDYWFWNKRKREKMKAAPGYAPKKRGRKPKNPPPTVALK